MVELMLERYQSVVSSLPSDLLKLYAPHLNKIRACLEPGMSLINWTCHTWEDFTTKTLNDVGIIKDLFDRANDIYVNRVDKLLESIADVQLSELPTECPWTVDTFVDKIKTKCKEGFKELNKKSMMIEDAVEDLILLALEFTPEVETSLEEDSNIPEEVDLTDNSLSPKKSVRSLKAVFNASKVLTKKDEEEDLDLTPANVLSVLDNNQRAVVNTAAKKLRLVCMR